MSIEKRLRKSFAEITPPTDNGTIIKNVIERAENMKNNESRNPRLNRTAVTIIAAAAVLAAATVSVGAATGWSFNSAFSQANQAVAQRYDGYHNPAVYSDLEVSQNGENTEQQAYMEQTEPFDFLSGGKELDLWYSFDDFKLNIKGVCADDYAAYVLYDIVFDEDFDHSPKPGWTEWEVTSRWGAVDKSLDEQPENSMVCMADEGVISREGNILHCYVMPMLSNEYTWGGKTMTLDFDKVWRYVPSHSESEEIKEREMISFGENGLHVEIPVDFPIFETTTWEINQTVDLSANESNRYFYGGNKSGTVRYFSATPLGYRVYVETDVSDFTKGDSYCFDISADFDGNAVSAAPGHGFSWTDDGGQGEIGIFTQPVDTADIRSITLCGQNFELK